MTKPMKAFMTAFEKALGTATGMREELGALADKARQTEETAGKSGLLWRLTHLEQKAADVRDALAIMMAAFGAHGEQ